MKAKCKLDFRDALRVGNTNSFNKNKIYPVINERPKKDSYYVLKDNDERVVKFNPRAFEHHFELLD